MTLQNTISNIHSLQNEIAILERNLREIKARYQNLQKDKTSIENSSFIEYVPIGEIILFERFERFNGVMYSPGDTIELMKKNPKSFVFKWVNKKNTDKRSANITVKDGTTYHRISTESFQIYFLSTRRSDFLKYLIREDNLKHLGI